MTGEKSEPVLPQAAAPRGFPGPVFRFPVTGVVWSYFTRTEVAPMLLSAQFGQCLPYEGHDLLVEQSVRAGDLSFVELVGTSL